MPTPDATGTINLSGTAGKVVLVMNTNPLTGSCPINTSYVDIVGYGPTASCFATAPTAATTNSTSAQRSPAGNNTGNNSTNFIIASPTPTNSSGVDLVPPAVTTLSPANNAVNVATFFTATITFNESIAKGTGNITLKKTSDNSVVKIINVATDATVAGSNISFTATSLAANTGYYFEVANGAITDVPGNAFAGFTGSTTWSFTTAATPTKGVIGFTYNFENCTGVIPDGFLQYSTVGPQFWGCTTFGRDPASTTTSLGNAVQMNGFSTTNVLNEDWFISIPYDLTATNFPLLNFWSRNAFNGAPLKLKASTNYPGNGDPRNFTWTDIDGRFPLQASNVWKQSNNINLAAFKSANTYFAFVYSSTIDDGARWTIDDITVENSATPPPPVLTANPSDVQFGAVTTNTTSVKTFSFTGNDVLANVNLNSTGAFLISKTNSNFTNTVTYTQAEANNIPQTVFVQFAPTAINQTYTGTVTVSSTGATDTVVALSGNSIDPNFTLDVVNWNIEWFGSLDFGPTNEAQQEANVKTITANLAPDLFALVEVVDEAKLQSVVANLNTVHGAGAYAYVLSNFGSRANPFSTTPSPLASAQKLAFVYKTSVISPIGTPQALVTNGVNTAADLSNPAYNYFSSGRYPYMMNANVTLNGITKQIRFVAIHAKANTSPTTESYNRRKAGADTLRFELNRLFPNDNIMLLGDFNDDLDRSITAGFTITSYSAFTNDNINFFSPTLALSLAGKKSTVSFNDVIDHVTISNELKPFYMTNTAAILTGVTSLVSNYGSTTSDHYPVFTRYAFDAAILPVKLVNFTATKKEIASLLNWATTQEINSKHFVIERSADGIVYTALATVLAAGNSFITKNYTFIDEKPHAGNNYYRLKMVDNDGKFEYSPVRIVNFATTVSVKVLPNPATDFINIVVEAPLFKSLNYQLTDKLGKVLKIGNSTSNIVKVPTTSLARGIYQLKVLVDGQLKTLQVMIQ